MIPLRLSRSCPKGFGEPRHLSRSLEVLQAWCRATGSLLLVAAVCDAQVTRQFDPLEIPKNPMLICENVSTFGGTQFIGVKITFTESEPAVFIRRLSATYDSSGRPESLQTVTEVTVQSDTSYMVAVAFYGDGRARGARAVAINMIEDASPDTGSIGEVPRLLGPLEPISNDDVERARQLVGWMWQKRCPETKLRE